MGARVTLDTASSRFSSWNDALLEVLLPVLPDDRVGDPVLLACDDEAVRVAGQALGLDPSAAAPSLAQSVRYSIGLQEGDGIRGVLDLQYRWSLNPRPRPRPDFLAPLALFVLAASRMGPSERNITLAYYPHLRKLVGLEPQPKDPGYFHLVPELFRGLAEWLRDDEQGRRGTLWLGSKPWPPFVGYCVEQTVFREADRRVLSQFFSERRFQRRGSQLDNLLLLRRWGGRFRLTDHALSLVEDPAHADRVRSAISSALATWDGSSLEKAGGRSFELRLRLGPRPLKLFASAANSMPVTFEFLGRQFVLEPQREIELPWDIIQYSGKVLGEPNSAGGAARIPGFDETILFENFDDEGLRRVITPTADRVWVLSKDRLVQVGLRDSRIGDSTLPYPWQAYRDVAVNDVPGAQVALVEEDLPPLAIAGGLRVQDGFYLSEFQPNLEAGDIGDGEPLVVLINGVPNGRISSHRRLRLPAEAGQTYVIGVPGLGFAARYHVVDKGPREGYGALSYHPADPASLRSGAMPTRADSRIRISGAQITPPYRVPLPIMRRLPDDVITIQGDGTAATHHRPANPPWLTMVNYPVAVRWEIPSAGVVWLLCPTRSEATRCAHATPKPLTPEARVTVLSLGPSVIVKDRIRTGVPVIDAWRELCRMAEEAK